MSPLKRTFWLGTGLILVSNAVALGGVYYNRSGEPDSVLRLSERELTEAYNSVMDSDAAGKVLELEARLADGWVTADRLRGLGFEVGENGIPYNRERQEREGLVVLELNGAQYERELATAEAELKQAQSEFAAAPDSAAAKEKLDTAEYGLSRFKAYNTRLYVVDAGFDAASLRERYPDRRRYSLARASLRPGVRWSASAPTVDDYTLYFDLAELSVPSRWRSVFSDWQPYNRTAEDRANVSVEVTFGKRFEPWITSAKAQ